MAAFQTGIAADTGKLLLRLSLAALLLFHGISKITGGVGAIVGLVEKAGLPGPLGYFVYAGEVLAPLLLVVGLWTRAAAAVVAVNMVVAVYLVHMQELFTLSKSGGWALELQGFYFFTALALVLLGAGRFSVGGAGGRFN
jgi:putative oxidoreductase